VFGCVFAQTRELSLPPPLDFEGMAAQSQRDERPEAAKPS